MGIAALPAVLCCRNIGFIAFMLPRACIIHTDRHPAATAFSCYAQPFEGRGAIWATDLEGLKKKEGSMGRMCCCSLLCRFSGWAAGLGLCLQSSTASSVWCHGIWSQFYLLESPTACCRQCGCSSGMGC